MPLAEHTALGRDRYYTNTPANKLLRSDSIDASKEINGDVIKMKGEGGLSDTEQHQRVAVVLY